MKVFEGGEGEFEGGGGIYGGKFELKSEGGEGVIEGGE